MTVQLNAKAVRNAQLSDFMEDYARAIDRGELERWPGFFEETCVYKVTSQENVDASYPFGLIYADSRAMLHDRVKSLREANIYEGQRYRHLLGRPFVVGEEAGGLRVETSFLVLRVMHDGETSLFASGVYRDLLRVDGEHLGLIERIVVCDSSRIDTLLALPL